MHSAAQPAAPSYGRGARRRCVSSLQVTYQQEIHKPAPQLVAKLPPGFTENSCYSSCGPVDKSLEDVYLQEAEFKPSLEEQDFYPPPLPPNPTQSASSAALQYTQPASSAALQYTQSASRAVLQYTQPTSGAALQYTQPASSAALQYTQSTSSAALQYTQPASRAVLQYTQPASSAVLQHTQPESSAVLQYTQPASSAVLQHTQPESSAVLQRVAHGSEPAPEGQQHAPPLPCYQATPHSPLFGLEDGLRHRINVEIENFRASIQEVMREQFASQRHAPLHPPANPHCSNQHNYTIKEEEEEGGTCIQTLEVAAEPLTNSSQNDNVETSIDSGVCVETTPMVSVATPPSIEEEMSLALIRLQTLAAVISSNLQRAEYTTSD